MTKTTHIRPHRLAILAGVLAAAPTLAQTIPPDYGHDFVTIGAPGNRGATAAEAPMWRPDLYGPLGAVEYSFRISRTEVTNAQYFEFVSRYVKTPGFVGGADIFGSAIFIDGYDPQGFPIVRLREGAERHAADPSFRYAARYANWLHNGKGTNLADFETGAYDASTFGVDPVTGQRTDQIARSPGATFFLPTIHEWTKAAHYDPDRYGEGVGGYWTYPGASEDPLVAGPPGEPGAQTSAGIAFDHPEYRRLDVGLYPSVASPWGLLDVSGGEEEVTESIAALARRYRFGAGSSTRALDVSLEDRLDWYVQARPENSMGFRIASVVPAPSGSLVIAMAALGVGQRCRRNRCN